MARRRSLIRRSPGLRVSRGALLAGSLIVAALTMVGLQIGVEEPTRGLAAEGDDMSASVGQVATAPARGLEHIVHRVGGMWDAAAQVERLQRENAELRAWRTMAEQLAERNARYEALLGMPDNALGEGASPEDTIAAQLVLDAGGPFRRTLVANAGADHGVQAGYVVFNENGLIGRVVSVGRRSSRVLLIDDDSSRVPVMGASSRVRAVLVGDAGRRPQLATEPFALRPPRLDYIVGAHSLRDGEPLVTSGDGGVFPRGMPVGQARLAQDGAWRVTLLASRGSIDFVRIMPYTPIEAPETDLVAQANGIPPAPPLAFSGPASPLASASSVAAPSRPTAQAAAAPSDRAFVPPSAPPPAATTEVDEPPPAPDAPGAQTLADPPPPASGPPL
ncbi:MAG: rod shape-determining protein MreC [Alphaproteobacteria bacterium]|nr:rod shape-determining protein MreC [Alphaproteobacteria bacterium]